MSVFDCDLKIVTARLLPSISADPLHSAPVSHRWVGPSCGRYRGSVFQGWPVFRPCCSILPVLGGQLRRALVLLLASFESSWGHGAGASLTLSSVTAHIASSVRQAISENLTPFPSIVLSCSKCGLSFAIPGAAILCV